MEGWREGREKKREEKVFVVVVGFFFFLCVCVEERGLLQFCMSFVSCQRLLALCVMSCS